jgi:hypothetical protein
MNHTDKFIAATYLINSGHTKHAAPLAAALPAALRYGALWGKTLFGRTGAIASQAKHTLGGLGGLFGSKGAQNWAKAGESALKARRQGLDMAYNKLAPEAQTLTRYGRTALNTVTGQNLGGNIAMMGGIGLLDGSARKEGAEEAINGVNQGLQQTLANMDGPTRVLTAASLLFNPGAVGNQFTNIVNKGAIDRGLNPKNLYVPQAR